MTVDVRVVGDNRGLLSAVRDVVDGADEALLCVAFANEGGVNLLAPQLASAGRARLLATTVFGDTTARALAQADDLGVTVRVLNPAGTYHPKVYLGRHGGTLRAVVGSANLTTGLLRNVEVASVLAGPQDSGVLAGAWTLAEDLWRHPAAVAWRTAPPAEDTERFVPDLWERVRVTIVPGTVLRTLSQGRPNRIVGLDATGMWIETERSRARGVGGEFVPAWMFNVAWEELTAGGELANQVLLHDLNVKRSSAVCMVLAQLPGVAHTTAPRLELRLVGDGHRDARAAEPGEPYRPR